jgi:ankyrin repeat protein
MPNIARKLISCGADVHHISARGWTTAISTFCYATVEETSPAQEILEILSASNFTGFDVQDAEGWTCMHRAAAYGNATDIQNLRNVGASLIPRTLKLSWMPIFLAVQFGNISAFNELLKDHPDFLTLRDIRQWSLLHVAVNAKQLDMMILLLELGADPRSSSFPTEFCVPDDLRNISVTPGEIARLRGKDLFDVYIQTLRREGHHIDLVSENGDCLPDIFWHAEQ